MAGHAVDPRLPHTSSHLDARVPVPVVHAVDIGQVEHLGEARDHGLKGLSGGKCEY